MICKKRSVTYSWKEQQAWPAPEQAKGWKMSQHNNGGPSSHAAAGYGSTRHHYTALLTHNEACTQIPALGFEYTDKVPAAAKGPSNRSAAVSWTADGQALHYHCIAINQNIPNPDEGHPQTEFDFEFPQSDVNTDVGGSSDGSKKPQPNPGENSNETSN